MAIRIGDARRLPAGIGRADSALIPCRAEGCDFHILRQRGSYADICHDHGRLLAREIEEGVFPEIQDAIAAGIDQSPGDDESFAQFLAAAVYRQLSDDVFAHASHEFRTAMDALAAGYMAGLADPRFDTAAVRDAVVAIDAGNLATGFARRMRKPLAAEVSEQIFYAIRAARNYRRRATDPDPGPRIEADRRLVARAAHRFGRSWRPGMGCTGFAAGPARTDDGRMLHGRTLDGAFFAWNTAPVLFLIDERATDPGWLPYAALGTAGLAYPGGISGLNMAGLSVSLHQMSTVNYRTGARHGRWDIAPFVQQRILREAHSLDEAVEIVEETSHFAAWTMLVADATAGRALRIELCGGLGRVEPIDEGEAVVQSNHFLSAALAEHNDYFADAHFTPTFGKWLETRARRETVGRRLGAARRVGTDWAIDMLADHEDAALGGDLRSFGRTVVKAYGAAAHVMRADPARRIGRDEVWMTLGDRRPGPHSALAGFALDFDALAATPVAERPVRRADTASTERLKCFAAYVEAFIAVARPRGLDGDYLGRDPTEAEAAAFRARALALLDRAVAVSEDAGVIEIPARYMRARLNHEAGRHDAAAGDWDFLLDLWEMPGTSAFALHAYEAACVYTLSAATEAALGRDHGARLAAAEKLFRKLIAEHFPGRAKPHAHLGDWLDLVAALRDDPGAELPAPEFVTVE